MVKKSKKNKKIIKRKDTNNFFNTALFIGYGIYVLAKFAGLTSLNGSSLKISGNTATGTLNINNISTYNGNDEAKKNGAEIGTVYKKTGDVMLYIVQ